MMRKTAFSVIVAVLVIGVAAGAAFATVTTTDSIYDPVIYDSAISFQAVVQNDGSVNITWGKYSHAENFSFYKVVRSQDVTSPIYPEDGYIYFTSNVDELSYTDKDAPAGANYYRICEIASPKRYCSTKVVKIVKETTVIAKPIEMLSGFSDVPKTEWYSDCVSTLAEKGVIVSGGSTAFRPIDAVQRAEFLKLIMKVYYPEAETVSASGCFSDVSTGWFVPYVCYAKQKGIVNGYDNGKLFGPTRLITRAEGVSVLDRGLNIPVEPGRSVLFVDVLDQWQKDVIFAAVKSGLASGYDSYHFGPNDTMTRSQAAKMICNAIAKNIQLTTTNSTTSTQQTQSTQPTTTYSPDNPDAPQPPASTQSTLQGNEIPMI